MIVDKILMCRIINDMIRNLFRMIVVMVLDICRVIVDMILNRVGL
jgi:hypothetical protein